MNIKDEDAQAAGEGNAEVLKDGSKTKGMP